MSRALVVLELAISCVLLVGAALTVITVVKANRYDLRFDTENLLVARLGLFEGDHPEAADWLRFYQQLEERLDGRSEVVSAAVGSVIPVDTAVPSGFTRYERPGEVYDDPQKMPYARLVAAGVGYFETLGVALVEGRDFTAADREDAAKVAIVNQDFARKEWPGQNAVGQRINLWRGAEAEAADSEAGWVEVVGVVPTLRWADFNDSEDQQGIYLPIAQEPRRFVWVVVRTRQEPLAFASVLRQTSSEIDPNLPLYFVQSMTQVIAKTMFFKNLLGTVFSVFGAIALLLASIGLYGVMAFGVARRTREMGVRMAFGARARDVLTLVLGQGLRQVAIGLGIGLVASLGLAQLLQSFLFQVEPRDPLVYALVVVMLTAVALLACAIPARRAASVDPIKALRWD
ncbi:MAG: FtsX-like permease family protein [Thermoanaerobaculia bacterium]|nr:FtsX-like permease family protein [Thermoanaerobaculia bacterium]